MISFRLCPLSCMVIDISSSGLYCSWAVIVIGVVDEGDVIVPVIFTVPAEFALFMATATRGSASERLPVDPPVPGVVPPPLPEQPAAARPAGEAAAAPIPNRAFVRFMCG